MSDLQSLVIAAQQGNKDAFGHIVHRFQDMAYAGAYAMLGDTGLAQDAAQEAFIDAFESLSKLREPAAFPGWFRRIVLKHSDRQIRRRRVSTVSLDVVIENGLESRYDTGTQMSHALDMRSPLNTGESSLGTDPAILFEKTTSQQNVYDAIAQLPAHQRLVTALFYVEGYSQKEISEFLEIPVTTIKKRLFTARKRLKQRMVNMVEKQLQENKPSQTAEFATAVQFFVALTDGDSTQLGKLLDQYPDLLEAKTEWKMSLKSHYWPLGSTPLQLATGLGDEAIVDLLLARKADVSAGNMTAMTPLHLAVIMQQPEIAHKLIAHGADVNARSQVEQTPLHLAVLRNKRLMADILINYGADATLKDREGRTPVDWAVLKAQTTKRDVGILSLFKENGIKVPAVVSEDSGEGQEVVSRSERTLPTSQALLGRVIDATGTPMDDLGPIAGQTQSIIYPTQASVSPFLQTGIKLIDLIAPLRRGGRNGIFTPLAGVGHMAMMAQLMEIMQNAYDGYTVYLGVEMGGISAPSLKLFWREWGCDDSTIHVFAREHDSAEKRLQVAETGLNIAEALRRAGNDVLLVVETELALSDGVMPYLQANTVSTPEAAITTVFDGKETVGVLPDAYQQLDSIITFDVRRKSQHLYPAIDVIHSSSTMMDSPFISSAHRQTARDVQRLLRRYEDLHPMVSRGGVESLWYLNDEQAKVDALRARKLHRFLTQPLYGAEPWTGTIGQLVHPSETVRGCRAILDGECDDIAEEAFLYIGTLYEVLAKAKA
ncbi:MAG: sigma-70 family RNA polymerase sigma factor [Chloroflexota bacterium]